MEELENMVCMLEQKHWRATWIRDRETTVSQNWERQDPAERNILCAPVIGVLS